MISINPKFKPSFTLELTPVVDIIFIVVVFLLLTTNSQLLSLPVAIPQADDNELQIAQKKSNSITITLSKQAPNWAIEKTTFSDWKSFKIKLLEHLEQPDLQLIIAASQDVEVEPLVQLLALLNKYQIADTQILIEEKPQP